MKGNREQWLMKLKSKFPRAILPSDNFGEAEKMSPPGIEPGPPA